MNNTNSNRFSCRRNWKNVTCYGNSKFQVCFLRKITNMNICMYAKNFHRIIIRNKTVIAKKLIFNQIQILVGSVFFFCWTRFPGSKKIIDNRKSWFFFSNCHYRTGVFSKLLFILQYKYHEVPNTILKKTERESGIISY